MAEGVKDGRSPWLPPSKHLWRLEHLEAASEGLQGVEVGFHSVPPRVLIRVGPIPAFKVGMGVLHPSPHCTKPAVPGLHLCCWKVPVYPPGAHQPRHVPCTCCPGTTPSSSSLSLAMGSSGGEADPDWQEAPGAGNDVSTHLSVIKSCV